MTIQELAALIEGEVQTKTVDTGREVTCGYTCDLLSWVMARAGGYGLGHGAGAHERGGRSRAGGYELCNRRRRRTV